MKRASMPQDIGPPVTDADVIRLAAEQPDAFTVIFERYFDDIWRYAARRLGDSIADDLAAETFLLAFDRRGTFLLSAGSARPWLYGIAANLIARRQRDEARHYRALARSAATVEDQDAGFVEAVLGRADAAVHRELLATALAELNPEDREVLLLTAWAGLTSTEIADALAVPPGTVRSRLHRARSQTRTVLGRAGGNQKETCHG